MYIYDDDARLYTIFGDNMDAGLAYDLILQVYN